MLVVKVELHSAISGAQTEIARMLIFNDGEGSRTRGNYKAVTFRGRDEATLSTHMRAFLREREAKGVTREGEVRDHPRLAQHVWNLVQKALSAMRYGDDRVPEDDAWNDAAPQKEAAS